MNAARWTKIVGIAIAFGFLAVWFGWNHDTTAWAEGGTNSNAQPANKIAVSGSSFEELGTPAGSDESTTRTIEILRGTVKTSAPTDLLLSLSMECALWTHLTVLGNDASESMASVKAWIEIDGRVVPVSVDDGAEPGQVVFCNRVYGMSITNLDDEDAEFQQFLQTRTANSFEWLTLNVGSGTHSIVAWAQLDQSVDGEGVAQAGIGKRTLVVEPVKLANNAVI